MKTFGKVDNLRQCVVILFSLCILGTSCKQSSIPTYSRVEELYEQKSYKEAAIEFDKLFKLNGFQLSINELYNGCCVYSLNDEFEKAFDILKHLVANEGFADFALITSDTDLENLHKYPQWNELIDILKTENSPLEERAAKELLKAKSILDKDAGKLWGVPIWDDLILILSADNTAYSLAYFESSSLTPSGIYSAVLPAGKIFYSSAIQKYNDKYYAVVMDSHIADNSATIIHELFHLLHRKYRSFNGMPINYMDNYDARELLRLEFQALRNCLISINENKSKKTIADYLQDAMIYRKIRQSAYCSFLTRETEIETSEGLANYTGFVLSSYPNIYNLAIREINKRENSNSYTRTFSYATGFAYGVIFDYLKMDWKQGLDVVYNFLDIYETKYLKEPLNITPQRQERANGRNNYAIIHEQETALKEENDRKIALLRRQLIEAPTLSVNLKYPNFAQGYDMNGIVAFDSLNIVYTSFYRGTDASSKNFGNVTFSSQNKKHEITGVLATMGATSLTLTFPLPFQIEGNKIIGDTYEITLNKNWKVEPKNEKGDFEIIEKIE